MQPDSTTRTIHLSRGAVALVDGADYERVSAHRWFLNTKGYAVAHCRRADGTRGTMRLHRFIVNAVDGSIVDHVNGDKLDNRSCNLRTCNASESACNRRPTALNASGYKGVSWNAKLGMWKATIVKAGAHHHLGFFSDAIDAATAYDHAAVVLHGDFAVLNMQEAAAEALEPLMRGLLG